MRAPIPLSHLEGPSLRPCQNAGRDSGFLMSFKGCYGFLATPSLVNAFQSSKHHMREVFSALFCRGENGPSSSLYQGQATALEPLTFIAVTLEFRHS